MDFLLRNVADVRARNVEGLEPLYCAVAEGNLDVVKWLIEKAASATDAGKDIEGWHDDSNYEFQCLVLVCTYLYL